MNKQRKWKQLRYAGRTGKVFPPSSNVYQQMVVCYHRIEELETHGVNRNDIAKLKAAGFNTIESVSIAKDIFFYEKELDTNVITHTSSI
jgi:vancomycin permeability regulator SanA